MKTGRFYQSFCMTRVRILNSLADELDKSEERNYETSERVKELRESASKLKRLVLN